MSIDSHSTPAPEVPAVMSRERWFAALLIVPVFGAALFTVDPLAFYSTLVPRRYAVVLGIAGAAAAAAFVFAFRPGSRTIRWTRLETLGAGLLLWSAATAPSWALHPSRLGVGLALSLLLWQVIVRQFKGGREAVARVLLHALWVGATVQAGIALRQGWAAGQFQYTGGFQKTPLVGTLESPNVLGTVLALGIVAVLAVLVRSRHTLLRTVLGMAIGGMGFVLVVGGARGAMLGLSVALGAVGLVYLRRQTTWTHRIGSLIPVVLGIGLAGIALVGWLYAMNPASADGRLLVWRISAPMVVNHPIAGVGRGAFDQHYLDYQAAYFRDPAHAGQAHQAADLAHPLSEYVQAFCETGLVGGLLYLAIWMVALGAFLRAIGREDGVLESVDLWLMGLTLVLAVHALVDRPTQFMAPGIVMATTLGLAPVRARSVRFEGTGGRVLAGAVLIAALGWAGWIGLKSVTQYPGYRLWQDGLFEVGEARIRTLESAVERLPGQGELLLELGEAYLEIGEPEAALARLERAERDIADRDLGLAMTRAYLAVGRTEEAEVRAMAVRDAFPDQIEPYLVLSQIYQAQGREEEARAALLRCIRRQSRVQTVFTEAVAREAETLWRQWFDDPLPS